MYYYKPAAAVNAKVSSGYRLTKGQVLLAVVCALLVLFSLAGFVSASDGKEAQAAYHMVTVEAGQTLWEIAKDYLPAEEDDLRDYVAKIREVNALEDPIIYPGQQLLLPVE